MITKKEFVIFNKPNWYGDEIICGNCKSKINIGLVAQIEIETTGILHCKCGCKINMDEPQDAESYEVKAIG